MTDAAVVSDRAGGAEVDDHFTIITADSHAYGSHAQDLDLPIQTHGGTGSPSYPAFASSTGPRWS